MTLQEVEAFLNSKAEEWKFSHFGIAKLERPLTMDYYKEWIAEGLQAGMTYLKDHSDIKENSQLKWPLAKSAFVFAVPYYPHPEPLSAPLLKSLRQSLYSQGFDYHHWFRSRMTEICKDLQNQFPDHEFLAFTDSSPILERDLARRAGLGWVGKNTCLIHPKKGSLFFIGEIYTSMEFNPQVKLTHDFCGNCRRCLDICPTEALIEPHKMDAGKCISYLTIESKETPPKELREKIGDWFFGCDLCQTVCPWNQKLFKNQLHTELKLSLNNEEEVLLIEELKEILTSSGKQLTKRFKGTPLSRASSFGLKRNAIIVATNRNLKILVPEIKSLETDPKLQELCQWSMSKLQS